MSQTWRAVRPFPKPTTHLIYIVIAGDFRFSVSAWLNWTMSVMIVRVRSKWPRNGRPSKTAVTGETCVSRFQLPWMASICCAFVV